MSFKNILKIFLCYEFQLHKVISKKYNSLSLIKWYKNTDINIPQRINAIIINFILTTIIFGLLFNTLLFIISCFSRRSCSGCVSVQTVQIPKNGVWKPVRPVDSNFLSDAWFFVVKLLTMDFDKSIIHWYTEGYAVNTPSDTLLSI